MDAKGRPTRLEDIISAESLIAIMKADVDGDVGREHHDTGNSLGIIKVMDEFISKDMYPAMNLHTIINPRAMMMSIVTATIICIDKAIRQRAEVDELREMADR